MSDVIIEELDQYKKEFGRKRRTVVENAEEAVFEEKKIEEQEVMFLMDRFGYAKTIDLPTYERNKEAADSGEQICGLLYEHRKAVYLYQYRKDASDEGIRPAFRKIPG